MKKQYRKTFTAAACALAIAAAPVSSNAAGIPTIDISAIVEMLVQELNQLDQLEQLNSQSLQQLIDYRLTLQNLQQLPGDIRAQVQQAVLGQLQNVVSDFGVSKLNEVVTLNPNSSNFYTSADETIRDTMGDAPMSADEFEQNLQAMGINKSDASFLRNSANLDRNQYRRVLDDMRQVALNRQNSQRRAQVANNISQQMANLGDNNTVGAIQLLSAQNSLKYAQDEDLLKTQNSILKNMQEQQARLLAERAAEQRKELARVQKVLQDDGVAYKGTGRP